MNTLVYGICASVVLISCAGAPEKEVFAADTALEIVEAAGPAVRVSDTSGVKLYLVGDSTVSPFSDPYYYPRYGYGTKIADYVENIEVINLALSGRSSKSFTAEENYQVLLNSIKEGDFLMIGFGHNDEKTEEARYTDPNGSIKKAGSFKNSLYENYIKIALDKGAIPILCTPIVRRSAAGTYSGSFIHRTADVPGFPGGDYAECIRQLGKETETAVIDMTSLTKSLYEQLGPAGTLKLHAWLGHKSDSVDNTHLNAYGASYAAYLFAQAAAAAGSGLENFVRSGIAAPPESLLAANPDYAVPSYEAPGEDTRSIYWQTSGRWRGTVFGDCGGAEKINPEKGVFAITETPAGVTLRSGIPAQGLSAGKISSSSDGITFYFQQIPAGSDFAFTADAEIRGIASNNQVSFGLMVRDDVYIDTYDNAVKTDYVACGAFKIASGAGMWQSAFERRSGVLGGIEAAAMPVPAAGQKIRLSVIKTGDTYTLTYGNEAPVSFAAQLTEIDKESVFAGLYTSRCCEVLFTDVSLTVR